MLRTLFLNPALSFTNQELAETTKADASNVRKLLLRWSGLGLVNREVDGRNIRHQASSDPLLQGLLAAARRSLE